MLAGVQGSGKTTACAKLAKQLKGKGKRPLLVAADLERPAAVEQLRTLGREIGVPVWSEGRDPVKVAKNGVKEAERTGADVVIIDTAGRLHVDPEMMKQARRIKDVTKPHHVLMACDAMTGQDAVDPGARVHARGRHHRVHPHEARRRRARRRRAVDHRGHRQARLLRGHGGEAR